MACRRDLHVSRFYYTLLLLMTAAVHLLASPISEGSGGSTIDPVCATVVCAEEYKCVERPDGGKCVPAKCVECSSNEPKSQVCASNGRTYNNSCEFEYEKCIQEEKNWEIVYHSPCTTLAPPKAHQCDIHQDGPLNFICDKAVLEAKLSNGTLQLSDLTPCYYPTCESDASGTSYSKIQCSLYLDMCWCSTKDGVAINGTLVPHRNPDCDNRSSCTYSGKTYVDGDRFHAAGQCGICTCSDGIVSCIADYVPVDGKLTASQTQQMKDELIQFYDVQHASDSHENEISIRRIRQHPKTIPTSQKKTVLEWKFEHYDGDGNDELSKTELVDGRGRKDMYNFFGCTKFLEHFYEMVDENENNAIVLSEWLGFFDIELQPDNSGSTALEPVKRSAPNQPRRSWRHKRRSRFLYSLK